MISLYESSFNRSASGELLSRSGAWRCSDLRDRLANANGVIALTSGFWASGNYPGAVVPTFQNKFVVDEEFEMQKIEISILDQKH